MLFILALFISSGAGALTINDTQGASGAYYGGTAVNYSSAYDVIGAPSFSVDSLTATQANGTTRVVLSGYYFGTNYAKEISGLGHIGDLYISSTGWKVNKPDDHARYDTFDENEGWDYVISYLNPQVYSLNFEGITMTGDEGGAWYGFRTGQAYQGGYGSFVNSATASLDSSLKTLTFTFPYLGPIDAMGFHWTMACGNDVVEGGGTPIPEPATMLLLGSGLLGIAGLRRKFKK
jgi:hypothetical protein